MARATNGGSGVAPTLKGRSDTAAIIQGARRQGTGEVRVGGTTAGEGGSVAATAPRSAGSWSAATCAATVEVAGGNDGQEGANERTSVGSSA